MNLNEVLAKRRSVRNFKEDEIPAKTIIDFIDLACTAPSAGAIRGCQVVYTDKNLVGIKAPVYIVVCANPSAYFKRYGTRGENLYSVQDATIVAAYIQLIAVANGFATVWIGAFSESKIMRELNLPSDLRPIAVIPLGYEAGV